jgi:hypothetical protein
MIMARESCPRVQIASSFQPKGVRCQLEAEAHVRMALLTRFYGHSPDAQVPQRGEN